MSIGGWTARTVVVYIHEYISLTNDAKDVSDIGHNDYKNVDHEEETQGDGDVACPMEGFLWEQELENGSANLERKRTQGSIYSETCNMAVECQL